MMLHEFVSYRIVLHHNWCSALCVFMVMLSRKNKTEHPGVDIDLHIPLVAIGACMGLSLATPLTDNHSNARMIVCINPLLTIRNSVMKQKPCTKRYGNQGGSCSVLA